MQDPNNDAKVAEYLRLSEQWTSLDLRYSYYFGSLAAAALLDHCEQLESLDLSAESSQAQGQRERLELTLESGLSELTALKKLERLGMRDVDQRIGVNELEWMSTAWPNLPQASGLFQSFSNDPLPGVYEWLRNNRYGWVP
ncbi:hypothetical protein BGZ52_006281, partial [Haplosporangium bisporale]